MTFWSAAFWGIMLTFLLWFVELTFVSILKLKIPFSALLISIPILWVAVTAFSILASNKVLTIGWGIGFALFFLSLFAGKIVELIEKWKQ